jgi:Cu(I)/Ag(I) efflux system protein CusF
MKSRIIKTPAALLVLSLALIPVTASSQDASIKGEVKKIDEPAGKITLRHGPIKNLGMDDASMTMVFRVRDPMMLKQVKSGDKVQFEADDINGQLTVTRLQKAN